MYWVSQKCCQESSGKSRNFRYGLQEDFLSKGQKTVGGGWMVLIGLKNLWWTWVCWWRRRNCWQWRWDRGRLSTTPATTRYKLTCRRGRLRCQDWIAHTVKAVCKIRSEIFVNVIIILNVNLQFLKDRPNTIDCPPLNSWKLFSYQFEKYKR